MPHLLRIADLGRAGIERILDDAAALSAAERGAPEPTGKLIVLAFFQESVRTRIGFTAAAARLGIATTVLAGPRYGPAMSGAESLPDTARTLGAYCDAILLRHPSEEAPFDAAAVAGTPVINCGNGLDEHPTQALVDLFAIRELRGEIDGARIALVGDLRHMRSVRSLLAALDLFEDVRIRLISPPELTAPPELAPAAEVTTELALHDLDFVYMAGFAPHTPVGDFDEAARAAYALDAAHAAKLDATVRILCPMPRIDEIAPGIDALPQAAYFQQSALGLPLRMAILRHALDR